MLPRELPLSLDPVSDAEVSTELAEELKSEAPSEFPSWDVLSAGVAGITDADSPVVCGAVPPESAVDVLLFSEVLVGAVLGRVNSVAALPIPSIAMIPSYISLLSF